MSLLQMSRLHAVRVRGVRIPSQLMHFFPFHYHHTTVLVEFNYYCKIYQENLETF